MKEYQIIYADPPWNFKYHSKVNRTNRYNRATAHYPTMSMEEICNLKIQSITDKDAALFMWVTYPFLEQSFKVIKAWGFKYKTTAFTWIKTNKNGSIFKGMGYWTMSNAEICLLATKGSPNRVGRDVSQVVLSQREKHSKKPDEVRNRIVALMGDSSKIELFARKKHEGWDVWGDEVESDIELGGLGK